MAMNKEIVDALVFSTLNGKYELKKVELGEMRDNEVLIRMVATGLRHIDTSVTNGTIPVPLPLVGGHEGPGIVERVGSRVTHVEPGDHILLNFSFCQKCPPCQRERPAYYTEVLPLNFGGSREDRSKAFAFDDGWKVSSRLFGQSSFAQKGIGRSTLVIKVAKDLPLDQLCALDCGVQTSTGTVLNLRKPSIRMSVTIFGVGSVGLSGIMAACLTPATKITAVDVLDSKLDLARQLGATHTINSKERDVVIEIRKLTGEFGVDCAFDATGIVGVIKYMIASSAPNSKVVRVGAPRQGAVIEIEPSSWLQRGVSYLGVHQGSSNPAKFIPFLIEYWRSGRFPLHKIVYEFREILKVEEDLRSGNCEGRVVVAMIMSANPKIQNSLDQIFQTTFTHASDSEEHA